MSDDIIARLRCSYADPPCEACTSCAARAEIEWLRALIRSYADARDGITLNWSTDRKGHWDLFDAADRALLEEARRG